MLQNKSSARVKAPLLVVPSRLSSIEHFNENPGAQPPLYLGVSVPHDIELYHQQHASIDVDENHRDHFVPAEAREQNGLYDFHRHLY